MKLGSRKIALVHLLDGYYSFKLYHMQPAFYLLLIGWWLSVRFYGRISPQKLISQKNINASISLLGSPALIRRCDDWPATITHVPVAAVLVLNTPDDGRLRQKHVEWPCRNKTCTVLHQVGVSFVLYYDARKHKIKKKSNWS